MTPDGHARTITRARFPERVDAWSDLAAVAEIELLQEVVTTIRTVRAELGVPPSRKIATLIEGADDDVRTVLNRHGDYVRRLAGLETLAFAETVERDPDTVRRVVRQMRLYLPLAGVIDRDAETARVRKELDKLAKQLGGLEGKLGNPKFRERAAPEVVSEAEAQQRAALERRSQLEQILEELTL